MEVKYLLCNPTGNITGLVESYIPEEKHPEIAELLLKREPTCEQVGFILPPIEGSDITLRMAGGEFCGNATMSTAALFCKRSNMQDGEEREVKVKVIGTKEIVNVEVEKRQRRYFATISMPKPIKISDHKFVFENHNYYYPVVEFAGISHVIIEDDIPVYMPERVIKNWCNELHADALGLMILSECNKSLRPLVYVKVPETLVWESSCASGTTAVCAYFTKKNGKPVKMELREPGGLLTVESMENGEIRLSGSVEF